ncbi:MAG: hypothetical protein ACI9FN_000748 [Saprospiraceae bacterium]|jgi:hypothetical protein
MNGSGYRAVGSDKEAILVNSIRFWMGYQPTSAIRLSLSPEYFYQNRAIQNVGYETFNNDPRYITGRVRQETLSLSLRLNYSLTPNISLEYWGQPFISKGQYSEFKYITDPLSKIYTDRFHLYDNTEMLVEEGSDIFLIDEDRDGTTDYSFNNPDFNFLEFRSNLVFRWEYKPNSEFFLVWTQGTTNSGDPSKCVFNSLKDDLFS